MKIEIIVDEKTTDLSIAVTCRQLTPEIEKLLAALRMMDHQLTVKRNGEIRFLDMAEIIYIESVERKCFIYTSREIYESDFKLYELEQQLGQYLFVRANKASIVNLKKIESIRTYVNRRLLLTMENGEQLIASRQYAENIKGLLGISKH